MPGDGKQARGAPSAAAGRRAGPEALPGQALACPTARPRACFSVSGHILYYSSA